MSFEAYLQSINVDPTSLTDVSRPALQAAWRASLNTAPTAGNENPSASFSEMIAERRKDEKRNAEIKVLVEKYMDAHPYSSADDFEKIGNCAMAEKWSLQKTELELLRTSRPVGPHVHIPSTPQINEAVVEAAVCRSSGLASASVEKSFDDKTLSSCDKHFKSGCSLQKLLVMGARANGFRGEGDWGRGGTKQILKYAFKENDAEANFGGNAGPSTISVSGILSAVGNKHLVDSFNAVEAVYLQFAAIKPVNDFKTHTGYQMTSSMEYEELGPGGKMAHGTLGEASYTNRARMYAKILGLDYQAIRNDDLGAFALVHKKMARGGAQKLNKVFWTKFLNNSNFFSTGNGNYRANADVAFTMAGLAVAASYVAKQRGPNNPDGTTGDPVGTPGKFLLVPTALDVLARQFMSSTRLSDDAGQGEVNVLASKWTVLSSLWMDDAQFTGSSASDYYILRDPADVAAVEIVALDGQLIPTIESADADFDSLGIQTRGYHAFGVELVEPACGYRFKQSS